MRNVLKYPLANEEILQTLQRMQKDFIADVDGPVGSMDGVVLESAHDRLKMTIDLLETWDELLGHTNLINLLKDIHGVK